MDDSPTTDGSALDAARTLGVAFSDADYVTWALECASDGRWDDVVEVIDLLGSSPRTRDARDALVAGLHRRHVTDDLRALVWRALPEVWSEAVLGRGMRAESIRFSRQLAGMQRAGLRKLEAYGVIVRHVRCGPRGGFGWLVLGQERRVES